MIYYTYYASVEEMQRLGALIGRTFSLRLPKGSGLRRTMGLTQEVQWGLAVDYVASGGNKESGHRGG